jgi:DNA-damage-inducible protein J
LKEQAEDLYRNMGTSFAEAIRIFAKQSVLDQAMPFTMHLSDSDTGVKLGLAQGIYEIPDDIDGANEEIAEMFGVNDS